MPLSLGAIVCLICYCGLNVYYCGLPRRRRGHVCPRRVPFELGLCLGEATATRVRRGHNFGLPKGNCLDFPKIWTSPRVNIWGFFACSISQQQWVQNRYIDQGLTNDSESLVTSGIHAVGELCKPPPLEKGFAPTPMRTRLDNRFGCSSSCHTSQSQSCPFLRYAK